MFSDYFAQKILLEQENPSGFNLYFGFNDILGDFVLCNVLKVPCFEPI